MRYFSMRRSMAVVLSLVTLTSVLLFTSCAKTSAGDTGGVFVGQPSQENEDTHGGSEDGNTSLQDSVQASSGGVSASGGKAVTSAVTSSKNAVEIEAQWPSEWDDMAPEDGAAGSTPSTTPNTASTSSSSTTPSDDGYFPGRW